MSIGRSLFLAGCLLVASPAWAQEAAQTLPVLGDVVHKGLVGKALDAVPMDPAERVVLQRTSAVVTGTLSGRTLSAWVGLAGNPILWIAGLAWGIYSALNIEEAAAPAARPDANRIVPYKPTKPVPALIARPAVPPVE